MSVEAIAWALNGAPLDSPNLVAVLVGLANHADAAGRGAAPSQRRLAHYARKRERTVREDLTALEALGIIRRGDQRRVAYLPADRRPVVWDLAMERTRDVPADLDAYAEPQSGRPAATPVHNPVDNRGAVERRPVVHRRPVAEPGGATPPPGQDRLTSGDADRGAVHRRRTNGLEEENPPAGENLDDAVRLLLDLPDPWRVGRRTAVNLAPAVAKAFAAGWSSRDLAMHLAANPAGVKSPGAVLRTRLGDLPAPRRQRPAPAQPSTRKRPASRWCGHCRGEDRMVESQLHAGKWVRCPACHPDSQAVVPA